MSIKENSAQCEKQLSPLEKKLNQLGNVSATLRAEVLEMVERLRPITDERPTPASDSEKLDKVDNGASVVFLCLEKEISSIRGSIDMLRDLRNLLEI